MKCAAEINKTYFTTKYIFTWHIVSGLNEDSLMRYESVKLVPTLPIPVLVLPEVDGRVGILRGIGILDGFESIFSLL